MLTGQQSMLAVNLSEISSTGLTTESTEGITYLMAVRKVNV